MFVWFGFRDEPGQPWQSGLLDHRGRAKPALASFARAGIRLRPTIQPLLQQGPKLTASDEIGAAGFGTVALSADGRRADRRRRRRRRRRRSMDLRAFGSTWSRLGPKLTPPGKSRPRSFGTAVALSADGATAAIAGVGDEGAGAVWIFTRGAAGWTQSAKLTPTMRSAHRRSACGSRCRPTGSTVLVGGNQDEAGPARPGCSCAPARRGRSRARS